MKIIYDADTRKPPKAYDDDGMQVPLPPWVQHAWATGHETLLALNDTPRCADCSWPDAPPLLTAQAAALAKAWDEGWESAARCYWHKPRNPYSNEMNHDDPGDYCPRHGGTTTTENCEVCT